MKEEMMGWQWYQQDHYANHLHVAPDKQPRQYLTTHILYRPDAIPAA